MADEWCYDKFEMWSWSQIEKGHGKPQLGQPISQPSQGRNRHLLNVISENYHSTKLLVNVTTNISAELQLVFQSICGPGSVVGIATAYGLDGPGIESRWGEIFRTSPDRP